MAPSVVQARQTTTHSMTPLDAFERARSVAQDADRQNYAPAGIVGEIGLAGSCAGGLDETADLSKVFGFVEYAVASLPGLDARRQLEALHASRNTICVECERRAEERRARDLNIRRVKAWAKRQGTRRMMAERLAVECARYESDPIRLSGLHRWLLIWETTGAHQELRKVVEWLLPRWKREGKCVNDPAAVRHGEGVRV